MSCPTLIPESLLPPMSPSTKQNLNSQSVTKKTKAMREGFTVKILSELIRTNKVVGGSLSDYLKLLTMTETA